MHIATTAPVEAVGARTAVFTASKIDVSYSGDLALQGVDMTIYANQVTAFIGPSGCGKSTYPVLQPHERPHSRGAMNGEILYHGRTSTAAG